MTTAEPNDTTNGPEPSGADSSSAPDAPTAEELRKALKAFKKRLKLVRLDDESRLGNRAMSTGGKSNIVAIEPPRRFPQLVWDELARQERLKYAGQGLYELVKPPDQR